jgi:hypothetical protein
MGNKRRLVRLWYYTMVQVPASPLELEKLFHCLELYSLYQFFIVIFDFVL